MNLKKGDKVKSDFHRGEESIIRTVLRIEKNEKCGSGYRVTTNGGEPCKCCGAIKGKAIQEADAEWFSKVT